jgi:hypothetical protein
MHLLVVANQMASRLSEEISQHDNQIIILDKIRVHLDKSIEKRKGIAVERKNHKNDS